MRHLKLTVMALFLGLPQIVGATTSNSVTLSNGGAGVAPCGSAPSANFSQSGTIIANINDGGLGCTMSVSGYAGGGAVGISGTLNHTPGGDSSVGQIGASASSTMIDIMLTPLFDLDDPDEEFNTNFRVNITLNAVVNGTLTAIVDNSSTFLAAANSTMKARASLSSASGTPFIEYFDDAGASNPGFPTSDDAIVASVLNPTLNHDWRFPFSATFNIQGSAGLQSGGVSVATSTFDLLNTLSFSKTGPAFILPDGFTVNAPELNIFDNQWIDPRPVPLPAGLPLLLGAIGVLSMIRKRGCKTNSTPYPKT